MTTHYMDEAERCHRLAFIFRGRVLDVGTPAEIVERRHLGVVEIDVERATEAADLLRETPDVDAVAHYGNMLRVAVRAHDPEPLVRTALDGRGIAIRSLRVMRPSVEDAFVTMVGEDERQKGVAA
jgi:ABC-2 type transport system ATP-binding protein